MPKSRDAFRTISEVADWLETPAHVLRFWESKFTQVKPVKRAGGRRYYRPGDMELLGGIKKLLHEDGMTIKGVQKVLREQGVRYVSGLSSQVADGDDEGVIDDAPYTEVPEQPLTSEVVAFPTPAQAQLPMDMPAVEQPLPEAPRQGLAPPSDEPLAQEAATADAPEAEEIETEAAAEQSGLAPQTPDDTTIAAPEETALPLEEEAPSEVGIQQDAAEPLETGAALEVSSTEDTTGMEADLAEPPAPEDVIATTPDTPGFDDLPLPQATSDSSNAPEGDSDASAEALDPGSETPNSWSLGEQPDETPPVEALDPIHETTVDASDDSTTALEQDSDSAPLPHVTEPSPPSATEIDAGAPTEAPPAQNASALLETAEAESPPDVEPMDTGAPLPEETSDPLAEDANGPVSEAASIPLPEAPAETEATAIHAPEDAPRIAPPPVEATEVPAPEALETTPEIAAVPALDDTPAEQVDTPLAASLSSEPDGVETTSAPAEPVETEAVLVDGRSPEAALPRQSVALQDFEAPEETGPDHVRPGALTQMGRIAALDGETAAGLASHLPLLQGLHARLTTRPG